MNRALVPLVVSDLIGGRPVRWVPTNRLVGDYDGRERTLQIRARHRRQWWRQTLEPIGDLMDGKSVPWTVEAGEVFVIFNAGALMPHVSEYKDLLGVALGLWDEWRARSGGR
jgi:hypothetical protein